MLDRNNQYGMDTFDDLLLEESRREDAVRRRCRHCFVWTHDADTNVFAIRCGHGCGLTKLEWMSTDVDMDLTRYETNRKAYAIAHARGCPRDQVIPGPGPRNVNVSPPIPSLDAAAVVAVEGPRTTKPGAGTLAGYN